MPDITMCTGLRCDKKYDCYRFMAEPSSYQSMAQFSDHNGECKRFVEIDGSLRLSKKRLKEKENKNESSKTK